MQISFFNFFFIDLPRTLLVNGKYESLYLQESEEEKPFGVWKLSNDSKSLSYYRTLAWSPASVYELEFPAGLTDLSRYQYDNIDKTKSKKKRRATFASLIKTDIGTR